jgi:hypothetical protein
VDTYLSHLLKLVFGVGAGKYSFHPFASVLRVPSWPLVVIRTQFRRWHDGGRWKACASTRG